MLRKLGNNIAYVVVAILLAMVGGVAFASNLGVLNATQKGDLVSGLTSGNYQLLHPGADNTVLTASSTSLNGIAWQIASGTSASLSGGINGFVTRWTSGSSVSTGILLDNATVAGANATSSTVSFNVQGTTTLNPFNVSSSTGTSILFVGQNSRVGIGTTTPGQTLVVVGSTTITSLGAGVVQSTASGNLLIAPVTLTSQVTGLLPVANGGLASSTLGTSVVGGVVNDTNVTGSIANNALTLGWTGTLSVARGGLASTTLGTSVVGGVINDTNVTGSIANNAITLGWTGQLAVSRGGTGTSTLTDHGVLVGSGTSAIDALSVGTNGQLLVGSAGADPVFATANCAANLTCTLGAGSFQIDVDDPFTITKITATNASTTNMTLSGRLYDNINSAGTLGMVLQTTATSTQWVATSTLGISGSLSGGSNGSVARWTSASTLSTGILYDNATIVGVNATNSTTSLLVQGTTTLNPFQVNTSTGVSLLRVSANGSVSIGTTSVISTLYVQGTSTLPTIHGFTVASSTGAVMFTVLNNGNVGVNSSTPTVNLVVQGNSGQTTPVLIVSSSSNASIFSVQDSVTPSLSIGTTTVMGNLSVQGTTANTTLPLAQLASSTGTVIFHVGSNAKIGINTTTPNFGLVVAGTMSIPGITQSAGSQTYTVCGAANTFEVILDTLTCATSALKFKKDIQPLDVGLKELMEIKPVSFYKKEPLNETDSHRQMGVIADWVAQNPKLNEMLVTRDLNGEIHGFDYEKAFALTTKSIQEQQVQIESLKTKKGFNFSYLSLLGLLGLVPLLRKKV